MGVPGDIFPLFREHNWLLPHTFPARMVTSSYFPGSMLLVTIDELIFKSIYICTFFCIGNVTGQLTGGPACPGDTFTFNCTVTGDRNGYTVWKVNNNDSLRCALVHRSTSSTLCRPEGAFTARPGIGFGISTATSFSSTLSGTANLKLNGTLVECYGPDNNVDQGNKIGDSTLQILGQDVLY